MSQIRIDNQKPKKGLLFGKHGSCRRRQTYLMSEYAEFHSINENAYVNASNVAGMEQLLLHNLQD
jgi:hypothetical protein